MVTPTKGQTKMPALPTWVTRTYGGSPPQACSCRQAAVKTDRHNLPGDFERSPDEGCRTPPLNDWA
jgi:hypothetical protein